MAHSMVRFTILRGDSFTKEYMTCLLYTDGSWLAHVRNMTFERPATNIKGVNVPSTTSVHVGQRSRSSVPGADHHRDFHVTE